jgi:FSR family fosmidomycin resistance protein-like MFS transporter
MTTESIPLEQTAESEFQTGQVLTIVSGHFIHDVYTACIAPLLPVIIEKMSLSLTLAGSLTAIMQIPAVLNPFIGYLADKVSLRYFVIFAPGLTATLISSMGLAPNYFILAVILFVTGISVAAFHAPAPAMVAEISGKKVGMGMSLFMAGGELSRSIGPLLAVWAVTTWTLDGFYRIVVIGWAATLILFLRLRNIPSRPEKGNSLRALRPALLGLFAPLLVINFFRNFMAVGLSTYLPTFMNNEGANLWVSGAALSILEFAGVGGALLSGTISDRLGRKFVLQITIVLAAIFMLLFLNVQGWVAVPVLLALGFTALSTTPILLAVVQDQLPNNRAVGNGLFMFINFLLRPMAILAIGIMGDRLGLRTAFFWSAIVSLLAIPAIWALPRFKKSE